MGNQVRLDKYLTDMGCGSRSEVKNRIRRGLVTVNDRTVAGPDLKINPDTDVVALNGERIYWRKYEYYMLNKPAGYITATVDSREKTVMDIMRPGKMVGAVRREALFPVGRLDKDAEGLLLITNDGGLAHLLLSPKKQIPKTYYAVVEGNVTVETVEVFHQGVRISEDFTAMPAELHILNVSSSAGFNRPETFYLPASSQPMRMFENPLFRQYRSEVTVTVCEGKFHQVKRMFEAVDMKVEYLKRISMGPLTLDPKLRPGEFRRLGSEEEDMLKKMKNGYE